MGNIVERVARAIATANVRNGIDEFKEPVEWCDAADAYDLTNNNGRFQYDEIARAAIETMQYYRESVLFDALEESWFQLNLKEGMAVEQARIHAKTRIEIAKQYMDRGNAALKEQEKVG